MPRAQLGHTFRCLSQLTLYTRPCCWRVALSVRLDMSCMVPKKIPDLTVLPTMLLSRSFHRNAAVPLQTCARNRMHQRQDSAQGQPQPQNVEESRKATRRLYTVMENRESQASAFPSTQSYKANQAWGFLALREDVHPQKHSANATEYLFTGQRSAAILQLSCRCTDTCTVGRAPSNKTHGRDLRTAGNLFQECPFPRREQRLAGRVVCLVLSYLEGRD